MREDDKKEVLTRAAIRRDLREIYKGGIWSCIRYEIIVLIAYVALFSWFKIFSIQNTLIFNIVIIILFLLGVIYIALFVHKIHLVQKDKYYILSDTLVGVEDKNDIPHMFLYKLYRLHFASYGVFEIPDGENYKWSLKHKMNDKDIFNYSNANDSFYLITMKDKKKILVVYNKKLFELNENS